jgi:predicted NUDIX family NTP pyrophosphohydrolase
MKTNKIILPIPRGLLKALYAYEAKGTVEHDIKQLEDEFDVHDQQETTYEVKWPKEHEEMELVSTLIINAYLAGIDKGLSKVAQIEQEAIGQDNLALCKVECNNRLKGTNQTKQWQPI